jgi:hypothetical protein
LEQDISTGRLANEATYLVDSTLKQLRSGVPLASTRLYDLFSDADNIKSLSEEEVKNWSGDLTVLAAMAANYLKNNANNTSGSSELSKAWESTQDSINSSSTSSNGAITSLDDDRITEAYNEYKTNAEKAGEAVVSRQTFNEGLTPY